MGVQEEIMRVQEKIASYLSIIFQSREVVGQPLKLNWELLQNPHQIYRILTVIEPSYTFILSAIIQSTF